MATRASNRREWLKKLRRAKRARLRTCIEAWRMERALTPPRFVMVDFETGRYHASVPNQQTLRSSYRTPHTSGAFNVDYAALEARATLRSWRKTWPEASAYFKLAAYGHPSPYGWAEVALTRMPEEVPARVTLGNAHALCRYVAP